MNTRKLLLVWSVRCGALHAADAPTPSAKTNILWIVMDDVGAA